MFALCVVIPYALHPNPACGDSITSPEEKSLRLSAAHTFPNSSCRFIATSSLGSMLYLGLGFRIGKHPTTGDLN